MSRRKRTTLDRYSGTILDAAGTGMILDPKPKPRPASDPLCCCRTPEKGRAGGQRPMIRWKADGSGLEAYCLTCGKFLRSGFHRQRAATHALGLCRLPMEHLDLEDCVLAGLMLPEHLERPADPWAEARESKPVRRAMATGGSILEPEEHAALVELAEPQDLEALAEQGDLTTLTRLVETGADFTDGAEQG